MKRAFDIGVSLTALLVLSPLLGILGMLVARKLGRPILFRQPRPGLNGEVFELRKFRTMSDKRDKEGRLLPDADRLTSFGKWLRSTSMDELPTLINVLLGDMSLVGPRPLLVDYLPRYSRIHARRHEVRPGFTGWAQVKGRNSLSWPDRFDLDVWYVDHHTFWLDLKIMLMTVSTVLRREGVSAENHATMPEFTGYDES
ncbi:MAG: sugar transferase [Verrucomicrobiota bacterium]